jgi:large conductance mechanosensitive channel
MLHEFRKFVLRGNALDLAVGVVIGAAFNGVVQALVRDILTPLISVVWGGRRFADKYFTVHHSQILYGDLLNALISFLLVAVAVFFFVVQPINKLNEYEERRKGTDEPTTKKCPHCLSVVPVKATRCKFCTSKLSAGKDAATS